MTTSELHAIASAAGIEATPSYSEGCAKLDDGTYGPIVTTYYTDLAARDAKRGNTAVRRIDGALSTLTVEALREEIVDMQRELKRRAKETRQRIAGERWAEQS